MCDCACGCCVYAGGPWLIFYLHAHVSLWQVWVSACACLICFTLLIINSARVYVCCLSVSGVIFCSKCWLTGHTGHKTFLMGTPSIHPVSLPVRWHLCLLPGPLKIECIFTTVGKGLEVYLIKCCPFKCCCLTKRLVLVSASSVLTGTLWNSHWDLDRSQTWESVQIKPCGQIYWA